MSLARVTPLLLAFLGSRVIVISRLEPAIEWLATRRQANRLGRVFVSEY